MRWIEDQIGRPSERHTYTENEQWLKNWCDRSCNQEFHEEIKASNPQIVQECEADRADRRPRVENPYLKSMNEALQQMNDIVEQMRTNLRQTADELVKMREESGVLDTKIDENLELKENFGQFGNGLQDYQDETEEVDKDPKGLRSLYKSSKKDDLKKPSYKSSEIDEFIKAPMKVISDPLEAMVFEVETKKMVESIDVSVVPIGAKVAHNVFEEMPIKKIGFNQIREIRGLAFDFGGSIFTSISKLCDRNQAPIVMPYDRGKIEEFKETCHVIQVPAIIDVSLQGIDDLRKNSMGSLENSSAYKLFEKMTGKEIVVELKKHMDETLLRAETDGLHFILDTYNCYWWARRDSISMSNDIEKSEFFSSIWEKCCYLNVANGKDLVFNPGGKTEMVLIFDPGGIRRSELLNTSEDLFRWVTFASSFFFELQERVGWLELNIILVFDPGIVLKHD